MRICSDCAGFGEGAGSEFVTSMSAPPAVPDPNPDPASAEMVQLSVVEALLVAALGSELVRDLRPRALLAETTSSPKQIERVRAAPVPTAELVSAAALCAKYWETPPLAVQSDEPSL